MTLSPEQQRKLSDFPIALRTLVEAELAAGNSIIEVAQSFPAPPAGAYVKLANKVSTRTRASGDGLDFYERNSSIYSGEFTDAVRFYYVIEPPDPPPPEPDMDAIRRMHAPAQESLTYPSPSIEAGIAPANGRPWRSERTDAPERTIKSSAPSALYQEESDTGSTRVLHFRDARPPHEVQFALERELMTLFSPAMDNGKLCLQGKAMIVGAHYDFQLRFETALLSNNCYSLSMKACWSEQAAANRDYYRKTSGSWFALWTRELMPASPPLANEGSPQRYRQLCDDALKAEQQLDSIPAIQQFIIAALKRGSSFGTSHKEGGTNIYWSSGRFVRSDYGDYPAVQQFTDETEFLTMLRQFCRSDVSRNSGKDQLSEVDTWRLILRRMHPR